MAALGNYCVESDVDNWSDLVSSYTASTIAFVAATRTITDSANKFVEQGFTPNMRIIVSGTTNNDGVTCTILSVVAGTITLIATDELTNESAGSNFTITSGERQEAIERVEFLIEQITKDFFYSKAFSVFRDGNRNDRLNVGLLPDILTVSEVLVHGVALETSWYTYDANHIHLDPNEALAAGLPELHLRTKYKQGLFPEGNSNIKITGTYGWSFCPPAIKQVAIMLCRHNNDSSLYTTYGDGLKSEKIDDYSYTRFDDVKIASLTNISEADKLIKNYIRKKPMMSIS